MLNSKEIVHLEIAPDNIILCDPKQSGEIVENEDDVVSDGGTPLSV